MSNEQPSSCHHLARPDSSIPRGHRFLRHLALVSVPLIACWSSAAFAGDIQWSACVLGGVEGHAECTQVPVPESRSGRSSRTINIRVARLLPLDTGESASDPVVVLQGGPGQSAISLAGFYGGRNWRAARRNRTIVLIDQRGTGASNPLSCDLGGRDGDPQSWLYEMFPEAAVRACRRDLEARAALDQYTTENSVDDLEDVLRQLGYGRVDLYGTSYGTRVALRYLDKFPQRVRSLVLKGIVEPATVIPAGFDHDTEQSLDMILKGCAKDIACAQAYPSLARDYKAMRFTLARGPVTAMVEENGASPRQVTLSKGVIASSFRTALQGIPLAVRLSSLIAAAARGDYGPIAQLVLRIRRATASAVDTGMMLSVICAEDVPYLPDAAEASSGFLGSYWRDRVVAACRIWNVPADPAPFRRMSEHKTPALLISGLFDPATPPENAEVTRRFLPNSAHLVMRNGSHSFDGMAGCADVVIARFLDTLKPSSLDLSCGLHGSAPDFRTGA